MKVHKSSDERLRPMTLLQAQEIASKLQLACHQLTGVRTLTAISTTTPISIAAEITPAIQDDHKATFSSRQSVDDELRWSSVPSNPLEDILADIRQ